MGGKHSRCYEESIEYKFIRAAWSGDIKTVKEYLQNQHNRHDAINLTCRSFDYNPEPRKDFEEIGKRLQDEANNQISALKAAVIKNHIDIVEFLVNTLEEPIDPNSDWIDRNETIDETQINVGNALREAVICQKEADIAILNRLLNFKGLDLYYKNQALLIAVSVKNDSALEKILLQKDVDTNYKTEFGGPALNIAVFYCAKDIFYRLLSDKRIDPNAQGVHGETPLMEAARRGNELFVKKLITNKLLKINAVDIHGYSALYGAIYSKNILIVKMLCQHGIRINTINCEKETPLTFAFNLMEDDSNYEIVEYLLSLDQFKPQNDSDKYIIKHITEIKIKNSIYRSLAANLKDSNRGAGEIIGDLVSQGKSISESEEYAKILNIALKTS